MCFSQDMYEIRYRLQYVSDTESSLIKVEDFYLFSNGQNHSYFLSENFYALDSIKQSIARKGLGALNLSKVPKTKFNYIIEKKLAEKQVAFYDNILKYKLAYVEQPAYNWIIHNEKKSISNFECTKATLNYYGRKWTAWFTNDIPINDGPYKFAQLPGLIIKLYDLENSFDFELVALKKNKNNNHKAEMNKKLNTYKMVTKTAYLEAVKNINKNIVNELSTIGITLDSEAQNRLQKKGINGNNQIELIAE